MPHIHFRHARGLLAGTAAAMLVALVGSAAGATDLQGQNTVSNRQKLEPAWTPDGQPVPSKAIAEAIYTVPTGGSPIWDSTLTLNANKQSAEIAGNAATSTLSASAVHGDGGVDEASSPFAVLDNYQFGDNTLTAASTMTVSAPAMLSGTNVTLSNNANAAFARMNDASNSLSARSVDLGGDVVLNSVQDSNGKVMASTASNMPAGRADDPVQAARVDLYDNSAASRADGNRALNSRSTSAAAGLGGRTVLDSRQYNSAVIEAVTSAYFSVNGSGATQSAIGVKGNSASSMAIGNVALNAATVEGTAQPALVSNGQFNRGPVSAVVTGTFGTAMTGAVNASMVSVSGNAFSATAIGNQAVNTLTATGGVGAGSNYAPR